MKALVLTLMLTAAGCSTIDQVARGVAGYCATTTEAERSVMRERIDHKTSPHKVRVQCDALHD